MTQAANLAALGSNVNSSGIAQAAGGGTAGTAGTVSFKNRLINGSFQVWQYGTSSSVTGYGTADRWKLQVSGTATFSQETSVLPSGSQYALKWTTGASSSYGQIRQFLETANVIPLQGQTMTASALVRCNSTFTGNLQFEIGYSTSTDASSGSFSAVTTSITGTVNSSGYSLITATFTVPSNAVGLYIGIVPTVVQASGAIAYMAQVQLEAGSQVTNFDYRAYGTELSLCQRYCWVQNSANWSDTYNRFENVMGYGGGVANYIAIYPVTMRATPTFFASAASTFNLWNGSFYTISSMAIASYPTSAGLRCDLSIAATGVTQGTMYHLLANNTNTAYYGFTSEL